MEKKKLHPGDKGSETQEMSGKSPEVESQQRITCVDCGTSKTPLWRAGPAGPKSLCNACGIRGRKKRREVVGGTAHDRKHRKWGNHNGSSNHSDSRGNKQVGDGLKQRLLALGRGVLMRRSTFERQTRKLGEEEQAAVLLMALSYS